MKTLLLPLLILCACSGTPRTPAETAPASSAHVAAPSAEVAVAATPAPAPAAPAAAVRLEPVEAIDETDEVVAFAASEEVVEETVEATVEEAAVVGQPAPAAQDAGAAGGEAAPPQDAPPEEAPPEIQVPPEMLVNAPKPPEVAIPDIDKHRSASLPYVRTRADVVEVDLAGFDMDADPVLMVEGKPITRGEFRRRALLYAGENEIDKHITGLLTDQQIAREAARGVDVGGYAARPEDVDAKLEELKSLVRMQAMQPQAEPTPDDDPEARGDAAVKAFVDAIESSIGMEAYKNMLSADARFERVFMPFPETPVEGEKHDFAQGPPPLDEPKPDWMPQETWDALGGDEQGRMLRTFVKTWAIEGTGIQPMFKPNLMAKIRAGLLQNQGVKFFFDTELPPDVLLMVGDTPVRADELWPLIAPTLVDADIELIVRELLTLRAMHKGLEAAGKWMDDEQFAAAWKAENDQYAQSLLPLQTMIIFRGYSSLDRYREHFRYRQSYNEWRRESVSDDEVLAHYQGGGRLMFERGMVVADVLFAPLDGLAFSDASLDRREQDLREAIDAARATGEGWVTPVAERFPAPPPQQGMDAHSMQRSQIRMRMAESELSIFLTGYSLADDLFYHGHKGDVYGPWAERCRRHSFGADLNAGAWAVSIRDFTRRQPLPPFDGANRDLAYQDYLDLNYFYWAQESLKALLPSVELPGA